MHQLDNELAGRRDLGVLFVVGDESGEGLGDGTGEERQ